MFCATNDLSLGGSATGPLNQISPSNFDSESTTPPRIIKMLMPDIIGKGQSLPNDSGSSLTTTFEDTISRISKQLPLMTFASLQCGHQLRNLHLEGRATKRFFPTNFAPDQTTPLTISSICSYLAPWSCNAG